MKDFLRMKRRFLAWALVCAFIATLFGVVLQFVKGDVLDYAIGGNVNTTLKYVLILAGFILCECLFFFLYQRIAARYSIGCTKQLKREVFDSILKRSYTDYKQTSQGEYIAKYTAEVDMIRERQFEMLPLLGEILFKIGLVTIALFLLDFRIAIITIVLLTTPLYLPKLIEKRLQKAQAERLKAIERNLAKVSDWLSGFELIKNFSVEQAILTRFSKSNDETMRKLQNDTMLGITAQLITTLISYLSYFIVLACAALLVLAGDFSAGDFFVAIGMIDQLSWPLISLSRIIRMLVSVKPTCISMEAFIKKSQEAKQGDRLCNFESNIRYENVSFAYDDKHPVLQNFNLDIRKGMSCLLKGHSGCGKTTAVNLALRYYDADKGCIYVDGQPINRYCDAYGVMTVVRQDPILFNDSLRNNLTLYRSISDERLY